MRKVMKIRRVGDYCRWVGAAVRHPLVCVIDYEEVSPVRHCLNSYGVYGIFFHDEAAVDLAYGCGRYAYGGSSVICVAPGQVGGKEDNGETVDLTGWALLFHPDLLRGTPLEERMKGFSFFDYRVNEALGMTGEERGVFVSLMRQVRDELQAGRDECQDAIIVAYVGLILNLCQRLYNRQFRTRKPESPDLLARFDSLLHDYYEAKRQLASGMPTVQYCARQLCMSPNYFGDLVKRATGDMAGNYIRQDAIRRVKNALAGGASVSQAAYGIGVAHPQHLSRLFKKVCGCTPTAYRAKMRDETGE